MLDARRTLYGVFSKPVHSTAVTASAWFEVLITLERYYAVCYPMHVNRLATVKRVVVAIVIVWLVSSLVNIPRFFDKFVQVPKNNQGYNVLFNVLYSDWYHQISYKVLILTSVNRILLTYFTLRVLKTLRESYDDQMKVTSNEGSNAVKITEKQRRTTATLLFIVTVFILLDTPSVAFQAVLSSPFRFHIDGSETYEEFLFRFLSFLFVEKLYFNDFAYFCLLIKCELNFFIFCLTGKRYRQILRDACACCVRCNRRR